MFSGGISGTLVENELGKLLEIKKTSFTHRNVVNLFIVYELDTWSRDLNTTITVGDCSMGGYL